MLLLNGKKYFGNERGTEKNELAVTDLVMLSHGV